MITTAAGAEAGPIAHWPLAGDVRDASGRGHHGTSEAVDLAATGPAGERGGAAGFDGLHSSVTVADAPDLDPGTRDFSIAAWVHTEADLDDVPGDIVSKYDRTTRTGYQLSVLQLAGVTSSQPNARHIFFGIDAGREDASWRDCGRPGNNLFVFALAVYRDDLYAGTFESEAQAAGHVYRHGGDTRWIDCGSPDSSNAVQALAVHAGKLYAGTGRYLARGSSLPESPNEHPGGRVYRYEGIEKWVDCGKLASAETGESFTVGGLAVFRGALYAGVSKPAGRGLYRYEGGTSWTYLGHPGHRVTNPVVFNGALYLASLDGGGITRYDGPHRFVDCGRPEGVTQTYGFAIHEGELYTSSWPGGEVFRYGGGTSWTTTGRLGGELETMGMAVYNGKLYAGTLPLAEVYRYDGGTTWTGTGPLDRTPDVRYRRAWSMAIHRGKLYCGTLPSGHVYSFEAGKSVTHGQALPAGWCHLAAVRARNELRLYLNGMLVATSERFDSSAYDVSNERPLKIGFGPNDHWNGRLRDVALYDRALDREEVAVLAARHPRFRLATFSADVTISIGHRCMGVLPRKAATILDPLEARGFVLQGAGEPLVLVAIDWCEIRNEAYDQWRDALAEAAGTTRERVLVTSLHQHDAPVVDLGAQRLLDSVGLQGELYDTSFHETCLERVASALRASLKSSRRVTALGFGTARVERLASNRRVVEPDGRVTFHRGSNSGGRAHYRDAPEGLIDPYLKTLSFWDGDCPLLALHAYATHPMSYYGKAEVSADFVGHARRQFAKTHSGVAQIYVSGCSGDVTVGKYNDGSPENRPALAARLVDAMTAAWQSTVRTPLHQIAFRNTRFDLPFHQGEAFGEEELRRTLASEDADVRDRILAAMGLSSLERIARGQKLDLPVIDFGPAQIVLFPGETFVGYQLLAQRLRPGQFVVSIGYGECWPGYVPTRSAFAEGFGSSWRWVAPGADRQLRRALEEALQSPVILRRESD